ncbi:PH domain-containing protein [Salipaludibacillus aurantiacus]|uniref:PH domain-containing protein n=1 Tax=Salipaludibacillus aurantiacus TaxID=1601833 RepID=A0A1H9XAB8_9BACI|nr:PH domain-containing protein [Salipaludibacillus aurantiacus]SES43158.1 PH domain-containing protein [Salipaludibacillus aurantiacus]
MSGSRHIFTVALSRPVPEPYLKVDRGMRIFEIVFGAVVLAVFLFLIFHPDYSLASFPMVFMWLFMLIAYTASWNWSWRLGWNQRLEKRIFYVFEEDGLHVYFNKNKLEFIPYDSIRRVTKLTEPLTNLKQVQLFGRKYWVTPGYGAGTCTEYPTLLVYSTAIDEGVLVETKYEAVLLSPEEEDRFISALKDKFEVEVNV